MFQPVIATALEPAYETCVVERGMTIPARGLI
jgi:hypothetical protein